MNTSFITTDQIAFLDDLFPQFRPRLSKLNYIGTVSVFTFCFETANDLLDHWKNITNSIAAYYQSEFEDDDTAFERWNIYLFFLVREPVRTQLKRRIENNKFCCRKIVQDEFAENFSDDLIRQLINEHIINNDLDYSTDYKHSPMAYSGESDIYRLIKNSGLKVAGKRGEVDKDVLEHLYQQIIEII